jgi:hypothetical protein
MEKKKIDKIIEAFRHYRNLKEEGMVVGTGGFTSAADSKGPVAGFDPLLGKKKKNGTVDFRRILPPYKKWVKSIDK